MDNSLVTITSIDILNNTSPTNTYINPLPDCSYTEFSLAIPFMLPSDISHFPNCLGFKIPDNPALEKIYNRRSPIGEELDLGILFFNQKLNIPVGALPDDIFWKRYLIRNNLTKLNEYNETLRKLTKFLQFNHQVQMKSVEKYNKSDVDRWARKKRDNNLPKKIISGIIDE